MEKTATTCRNCGTEFSGNFCNHCGEKVYNENEKKIHHFFEDATHFLTHFDNKFFRTLQLVFTRPGLLSKNYSHGIRRRYFRPISLFLICVVAYLLFPAFKGLNMVFLSYYNSEKTYATIARPVAEKKMQARNMSLIDLSEKYNTRSPKISKVLLLLYIPLVALVLHAFFSRQRPLVYDQLLLATELMSFLIAYAFLLLPLILSIIDLILQLTTGKNLRVSEEFTGLLVGLPFFAVIIAAFRKFYMQSWPWVIGKSLLFLAALVTVIIPLYNVILFLTVMLFL